MFNPVVSHFRIHFFSVRPCFNFLTGASLSEFASSFMTAEQYYQSDPTPQAKSAQTGDAAAQLAAGSKPKDGPPTVFSLHRLGRRWQFNREFGPDTVFRAHKFWSAYMSKVAGVDYRGPWRGLAPLKARFHDDPQQKILRLQKQALNPVPGNQDYAAFKITAFPKLDVCPIGWAVGIVVDVKGDIRFDELPVLVKTLRTAPAFLYRNGKDPLHLDQALTNLHRLARAAMVVTDRRHLTDETARSYVVCSPLSFEKQTEFSGDEQMDLPVILRILGEDFASADETRRMLSPMLGSFTATRFNRGTLRIASSRSKDDHQSPQCALSNLKNCLLMTALMEQFHNDAAGHASPAVQKMREEVELTFMVLKSVWKSPHFHAICHRDSGLLKMTRSAVTNVYNFIQSTFQGVAIGDDAQVIQNLDPARRIVYLSAKEQINEMARSAAQGQR
jgi:hypothetical protein